MNYAIIKIKYIFLFALGFTIAGCSSNRDPGSIYIPDMAYSRAYESYAALDSNLFTMNVNNRGAKIFYNGSPVKGTLRRGDAYDYTLPNDSNGYKMSASVKNPYDSVNMSKAEMEEMGRLYNIYCGICHGAKGTANGPLAVSGKVGGVANLTLPLYVALSDGTMFHVMTYGKNNMGSYASQLTREQRWKIIKYVRTLQGGGAPVISDTTASSIANTAALDVSTDSTANK